MFRVWYMSFITVIQACSQTTNIEGAAAYSVVVYLYIYLYTYIMLYYT